MRKYLFLAVCLLSLAIPLTGFAQETEEVEYGYGSIVEVKKEANALVVTEYDWNKDEDISVTYIVHPDAKVENSPSWKEIPTGSYVDIEYVTDSKGSKVAKYIAVYEPESAEE